MKMATLVIYSVGRMQGVFPLGEILKEELLRMNINSSRTPGNDY